MTILVPLLIAFKRFTILAGALSPTLTKRNRFDNLVLSSAIEKNIGDRALLESMLLALGGTCLFITSDRSDFGLATQFPEHKGTSISSVFRLTPFGTFLDNLKLGRTIRSAKSVYLIGADIADGTYSQKFSLVFWEIASIAKLLKKNSMVVSFSWNTHAPKSVIKKAQRALLYGVKCRVRDPISISRFNVNSSPNVILSSDIVFSNPLTPMSSRELAEIIELKSMRSDIVLINISGFIGHDENWMRAFLWIASELEAKNIQLVFVPHVFREGQSDLHYQDILQTRLQSKSAYFISRELSPAQIATITRLASLVVTSRMHLGIIALKELVPTFIISTNGKTEGLMESIEQYSWSINSPDSLLFQIRMVLANIPKLRQIGEEIREPISVLKERSRLNVIIDMKDSHD